MRILITGGAGLHRLPSRRGAARGRPRGLRHRRPVDRLDRQHRAPEGPARRFTTRSTRCSTSRSSPSSSIGADVIFHLAAAVGVKLIVAGAGPHHRNQRARHRGHPAARREEEEARVHRVDLRGLRQEHRRAVPRGRRPRASARPPGTAGPTPAARRSTSSWRWPTRRSRSCRSIIVPVLQHRRPAPDRPVRDGACPTFVRQALAGEPITVFGDGTQSRSFTYVGDVVGALLKLMVEPRAIGQVFNIGNTRRSDDSWPGRADQGADRAAPHRS